MKRYTVQGCIKGAFWIRDELAEEFGMPARAVTLNFWFSLDAERVADILESEWIDFSRRNVTKLKTTNLS